MRVSELVTIDEVKSWNAGDLITIKAGTGAGKSYFIKNNLYALAKKDNKKILMLIHRSDCINQFQKEIEADRKTDVIKLMTYQRLEAMYKKDAKLSFDQYQYIVCDEFHYFMSDAAFNHYTDISLNTILNQTNKIRIFMSATGEYMQKFLVNYKKLTAKHYEIEIKFDFIKTLTFYHKDETLEKVAEQAIEKNQKMIFFIESAAKAYHLYKQFKNVAMFNCSKSNANYYKYVDEEKINQMLSNEKFDDLILITTTCMDAGVNLKDEELRHVICDVKDIGTLTQCIGRKRIEKKDDHINLLIKSISNQVLGGIQTQLSRKREKARFLKENSVDDYVNKYKREFDYSHIVYDDSIGENDKLTKKVNDLIDFKFLTDAVEIDLIKANGEFGYSRYLAKRFNKSKFTTIEVDKKEQDLKDFLEDLVEQKLYKEEQNQLINRVDLRVNGRQQKSYKKLNEGLQMIKLPFVIIKDIDKQRKLENGTDNPNRDKTYWMVMKSLG
ncbi:DEAD/DEAH box helicase family protein [Bacillus infantis]|uniref:DEAD/DEAH box helicase family protein n=1 Tax=Bacillus infantis TaxID=324767 RepID=UPI003CEE2498